MAIKRTYQRTKLGKKESEEAKMLSSRLPVIEELGVSSEYHFKKIKGIILDKYRAKSREHRDYQVTQKLNEYVQGVYDLDYAFELQKEKGFKPKKVKTDNHNVCYHCGKENVKPIIEGVEDNRYQCESCGSVHVPEGSNVLVFSPEEEPTINQFTEITADEN